MLKIIELIILAIGAIIALAIYVKNTEKGKIIKCNICGTKLELKKENKYVVAEDKGVRDILNHGNSYLECIDCSKCGCQNIINIRHSSDAKKEVKK